MTYEILNDAPAAGENACEDPGEIFCYNKETTMNRGTARLSAAALANEGCVDYLRRRGYAIVQKHDDADSIPTIDSPPPITDDVPVFDVGGSRDPLIPQDVLDGCPSAMLWALHSDDELPEGN